MMTTFIQSPQQWPVTSAYPGIQAGPEASSSLTTAQLSEAISPSNATLPPQNTQQSCCYSNPLQALIQTIGLLVNLVQTLTEKIFSLLGIQTPSQASTTSLSDASALSGKDDSTAILPAGTQPDNNSLPSGGNSLIDGILKFFSTVTSNSGPLREIFDSFGSILSAMSDPGKLAEDLFSRIGSGLGGFLKKGGAFLSGIF